MISYQPIAFTIGIFLSVLAALMFIPAVVDYFNDDFSALAFLVSSVITGFIGVGMTLATRARGHMALSLKSTFLLTAATWCTISAFSALPFLFIGSGQHVADAFFESVSGLTTTGATVMTSLDGMPKGILLWRALLQGLGGIGIIVMAFTVMPILKIGGMQLFQSEFSDRSEKILPRMSQIATAILSTYLFLIVLCILLLKLAGMGWFDAICHGITTVATGGFSTSDLSISYFHNVGVEVIMIVFMLISSVTLILWIKMIQGNPRVIFKDDQVRAFFLIWFVSLVLLTLKRYYLTQDFTGALRESAFTVTSIITTSGFANSDFNFWGSFATILLMILMMVGGCTGSTSGSVKVFRYLILMRSALCYIKKLRRPKAVFVPYFNGTRVTVDIFTSVTAFFAVYILSLGGLMALLSLYNYDFTTTFSAALSCLNNIGPGFGTTIGPLGSYQPLDDGAKWLLMGGMLLGRIEYFSFIVLIMPSFWRD